MLIQRTVQNNVQFVFGYRNLGPPLVTHNERIYWTHILYAYFDIENSEKVKKTPLLPSHGDQVMLCDILTCGSWLCWNVHLIWHCPIKCSFWAFVCVFFVLLSVLFELLCVFIWMLMICFCGTDRFLHCWPAPECVRWSWFHLTVASQPICVVRSNACKTRNALAILSETCNNRQSSQIQGTVLSKCLQAWTYMCRSMPAGVARSRHAFVGGTVSTWARWQILINKRQKRNQKCQ